MTSRYEGTMMVDPKRPEHILLNPSVMILLEVARGKEFYFTLADDAEVRINDPSVTSEEVRGAWGEVKRALKAISKPRYLGYVPDIPFFVDVIKEKWIPSSDSSEGIAGLIESVAQLRDQNRRRNQQIKNLREKLAALNKKLGAAETS